MSTPSSTANTATQPTEGAKGVAVRLVAFIVSLATVTGSLGFLVGHSTSPKYDDPNEGPTQIVKHVALQARCIRDLRGACSELKYRCQLDDIVYRPGAAGQVTIEPTEQYTEARSSAPTKDVPVTVSWGTLALSIPSVLSNYTDLGRVGSDMPRNKVAVAATATVAVAGYVFMKGYQFGHSDRPPSCKTGEFAAQLNDPGFWRFVEEERRASGRH